MKSYVLYTTDNKKLYGKLNSYKKKKT